MRAYSKFRLYGMLEHKLPEDVVHEMIRGAVEVEREFICGALSCDLIGMNKDCLVLSRECGNGSRK